MKARLKKHVEWAYQRELWDDAETERQAFAWEAFRFDPEARAKIEAWLSTEQKGTGKTRGNILRDQDGDSEESQDDAAAVHRELMTFAREGSHLMRFGINGMLSDFPRPIVSLRHHLHKHAKTPAICFQSVEVVGACKAYPERLFFAVDVRIQPRITAKLIEKMLSKIRSPKPGRKEENFLRGLALLKLHNSGASLEQMRQICKDLGWTPPSRRKDLLQLVSQTVDRIQKVIASEIIQ